MKDHPASLVDPVCGMTVDVSRAEADGLTVEYDGRTFAFCRAGCRRAFMEEPQTYAAAALAAATATTAANAAAHGSASAATTAAGHAVATGTTLLPLIDEGMRRWYESCSCCLSDAYPEIKAALDAERATAAVAVAGPGICEVAEGVV